MPKRDAKGLKIVRAWEPVEAPGHISAVIEFPDGHTQGVTLPDWADKAAIKQEARRLREMAEARSAEPQKRPDLED